MSANQFDGEDFLRVVRRALHSPTDDELTDAEILGHFVHPAQVELVSEYDFPWLLTYEDVTTVADQTSYSLSATDIIRYHLVEGVSDEINWRMKPTSQSNVSIHGDVTGAPERWWVSGDAEVSFWPTPSESSLTIRVWYFKEPSVITGAGDEPASVSDLGGPWDLPIAYRAIAIGLPMMDRATEVDRWEKLAASKEHKAVKSLPPMPEYKWKFTSTVSEAIRDGMK